MVKIPKLEPPPFYAVELGIIRTLIVLRSINNKQKHRLTRNTIMFALPPNDAFAQHKARTVGSESLLLNNFNIITLFFFFVDIYY